MDPAANQAAITQLQSRIARLDAMATDPKAAAATKVDAAATKQTLSKELELRREVQNAQTPEQKAAAEKKLADHRKAATPATRAVEATETCPPRVLRVHLHMRFLLPPPMLTSLQDAGTYPRRNQAVSADTFRRWYSLEGATIGRKTRWAGPRAVVGATVRLAGLSAVTDAQGVALFRDVPAGVHQMEVVPPTNQSTTQAAGPTIPVQNGYAYASAPPFMYRPFTAQVTVADSCWTLEQAPTITMPHRGNTPAYAAVVEYTQTDLYLDWKADWIRLPNRRVAPNKNSRAVVLHQTATTNHEQIGSPIDTFSGPPGTAAHYLVDIDGHVVKLVHESERAAHASAASHWHELADLDNHSIGIETVHTDFNTPNGAIQYREFTREQYTAINRLIDLFQGTFQIQKHYVCGHNDCRDGARDCPGDMFDWASIEAPDNALGPADGTAHDAALRVVNPGEQVAATSPNVLVQYLFSIGYTHKTVSDAVSRFLKRAWSGSRFDQRPRGTGIENGAAPPLPPGTPRPRNPPPLPRVIAQAVADRIGQMFRDL